MPEGKTELPSEAGQKLMEFLAARAITSPGMKRYEGEGVGLGVGTEVIQREDGEKEKRKKVMVSDPRVGLGRSFLQERLDYALGKDLLGDLGWLELTAIITHLKAASYGYPEEKIADLVLISPETGEEQSWEINEANKRRKKLAGKIAGGASFGMSDEKKAGAKLGLETLLKEFGFKTAINALGLLGKIRQREAGERIAKKTATG